MNEPIHTIEAWYWECLRKKKHNTGQSALDQILADVENKYYRLGEKEAYQCPHCKWWHVGRRKETRSAVWANKPVDFALLARGINSVIETENKLEQVKNEKLQGGDYTEWQNRYNKAFRANELAKTGFDQKLCKFIDTRIFLALKAIEERESEVTT